MIEWIPAPAILPVWGVGAIVTAILLTTTLSVYLAFHRFRNRPETLRSGGMGWLGRECGWKAVSRQEAMVRFRRSRERLEARLVAIGGTGAPEAWFPESTFPESTDGDFDGGEPVSDGESLQWRDISFSDTVFFVQDNDGEFCALVAVLLDSDDTMDSVADDESWRNDGGCDGRMWRFRDATAIFRFRGEDGEWRTDGEMIPDVTPEDLIRRHSLSPE